jgi:hypothetical protein
VDAKPNGPDLGPSNINLYELGFEENVSTELAKGGKKGRTFMTAEARLASNMKSGKANENYKKIDLKKKTYSKGGGRGKFMMAMEYKRKLAVKVSDSLRYFK